ncbi:hypothetical protein FOA52_013388 [Chlamydomonas sp. UWO 241]|nr:hypothetical protein FOA52_013388 [Chlamydomonas sp. UWO 241]
MSGCGHALVSNPLFGVLMDSPSADGAAASFGCFLVGTQSGSVWAYPLDTAGGAQGAAVGTSASAAHPGSAVGPEQLLFDFEEPLVSLFVQAAATCTTRGSSGRDTPGSGGQAAAAGDALVMVGARGRVVHVAASRDYASLGQGAFQVLSSFLRIARPPASAGCSSSPPVPKLAVREWSLPFDVSAAAQGPGAMLALLTPGGHVYLAATAAATVAAGSAAPAGGDGGAQGSGVALHVVRLLAPGPVAALDWELPRRTHSHAHPRQQQQQQQGPALVLRTASGAVLASQPWHVAAGSGGEGATAAGGELALLPAVWRGVVEAAGLGSQQARDGGACGGSGGGSGAASASACWPCMPLLGEPLPLRSAPALARALRATVAQLSRGRSNADTLRSQMHAAARRLEASGRDAAALRAVAAHGGCLADCGSSGGGGGGIGAELSVPLLLPGGGGRGSPPQLQVTALVALPAGASGSGGVDGAGSSSGGSRGGAWQLVVRWVPDDVRMAASVASCRVDQGGAGAPPSGGGGVSTGEPPRAVLLLLPLVPSEQGGRGGVGGWLQAFAVRALRRGGASTTSRGDGSGGAGTSGGGAGRTRQLAAVLLSEAYLTPTQLRMVPTLAADWLRLPHPSAGAGAARRDHSHGAPARHHGHSAALMWSLDAGAPAAGAPTAQQHSGACAAALSHVGRLLRRALGDVSGGDARAVGLARTISAADAQHFPPCAHSSGGGGGGGGAGPSHAPPAAGAGAGSDAGGEAFVVAVWGGRASVAWRVHPGCHGGAAVVAGGGGGGAPAAGAGPRAPPSSAAVAAAAAPAAAPAALMVELHLATADAHTLLSLHQALATAAAAAAARSAARSSSTRHGRGAAARGGGAVPSGAVPSASPPASTCSSLMYRPQLQPAFSRLRGLLAQLRGLQESVRAASRLRCTLDECSADAASVVDEAAVAGELQAHQASLAASLQTASVEQLEQDCWNCDNHFERGGLVCNGCKKVQPLDKTLNYFQLLGMPDMTYDLDPVVLEKRYKSMQWSVHPDRMAHTSSQEQGFSADTASMINMGYSVLRNPLSRANYMLGQMGIHTGEERSITDPAFLMEVMEAREEVEDTEDEVTLTRLLSANRESQREVVLKLGAAFSDAATRPSPEAAARAAELTARLAYMARLESSIMAKLPSASGEAPGSGALMMD